MATAVTTFAFATTLQSWSSIAALASGETNGLDTVNGNPADALFGKLVGKTKATTAGAGMKFSQALSAWGVPAGATVTAVSVALDKKCVTAPGSAIGSGSFNTKLNLNAGASINSGPTQTLSTTADTSWTTLATGSNAALSGLSDSTLTHLLEVDILYTLSTTSSALTSTTWQIDWDNVVVTITYTVNVPGAPGTPAGTGGTPTVPLTWSDNANDGGASVTDHHVYVYDAPSGGSLLNTINTASASASYTVTDLTIGLTYYFEVTATNSAGESAHSARSSAIIPLQNRRQTVYANGSSGTNVASLSSLLSGSVILVAVSVDSFLTTIGVSDNLGTPFARIAAQSLSTSGSGDVEHSVWMRANNSNTGGSPSVTATFSGSTATSRMVAVEVAGSALAVPLAGMRGAEALANTAVSQAVSTSKTGDIAVAFAMSSSNDSSLTAIAWTAPFVGSANPSTGSYMTAVADDTPSPPGPVTATATMTATAAPDDSLIVVVLSTTSNFRARSAGPVLQAANRAATY